MKTRLLLECYTTLFQKSIKPTSPTARPAPLPPPKTGCSASGCSAAAVLPICRSANQPSSNQPASWAHQLARQQTNNRATASYSTANQPSKWSLLCAKVEFLYMHEKRERGRSNCGKWKQQSYMKVLQSCLFVCFNLEFAPE